MKTALVCVAKNEDAYIGEWIDYHLKLGFDDVFVYQNNWRYTGDKSRWQTVHWIEFDGECKQLAAYNDFIANKSDGFDWAGFYDVDEFLCLKIDKDLESFLSRYSDFYGVAVNWRCFGDNNLEFDGQTSVLERFTKCQSVLDRHVKTILNLSRSGKCLRFVNPHFVGAAAHFPIVINTDRNAYVCGPWDTNSTPEIAQLNHYHCKTKAEWKQKMERGRADVPVSSSIYHYSLDGFKQHNFNEVEDFTARDFMRTN